MRYSIKMVRHLTNKKSGGIIVSDFSRTVSAGNTVDAEHIAESVMGPAWEIQTCEEVHEDASKNDE